MQRLITATFEDGVLKPHQDLGLRPGSTVRLILASCDDAISGDALDTLDQLCDEFPVISSDPHLTRDRLHDRN